MSPGYVQVVWSRIHERWPEVQIPHAEEQRWRAWLTHTADEDLLWLLNTLDAYPEPPALKALAHRWRAEREYRPPPALTEEQHAAGLEEMRRVLAEVRRR